MSEQLVRVAFAGVTVAETTRALRVLETSHPPVYYVPPNDVLRGALVAVDGTSFCEWKGSAAYFDVTVAGKRYARAAWSYPRPSRRYADLVDHVAFYPTADNACYVGGERVRAQAGDFYGGWITDAIVGPYKGGPGTTGW